MPALERFAMRVFAGTSGYSYTAWRGSFYPERLPAGEMLRFYATRLPTVEINNTFYRMPNAELLERWARDTPDTFSLALKAPQRITHVKRLNDPDSLAFFLKTAGALGGRLGPVLFQLPPFMKKDLDRLRSFLALLPEGVRAAFEFRHATWLDDDVHAALRDHGAALCLADTDEQPDPDLVVTADWGYLRLRRAAYDEAALASWADRIRSRPWAAAWTFFKHEEEGRGAAFAETFQKKFGN